MDLIYCFKSWDCVYLQQKDSAEHLAISAWKKSSVQDKDFRKYNQLKTSSTVQPHLQSPPHIGKIDIPEHS